MQMSWVEAANFLRKFTALYIKCCVALSFCCVALPHLVPLTISVSCHACRGYLGYPIMIYLSFTRPKDDNLKSTSMNTATVKIPTTADLEDDTLKDLPNPFYGYGTHQEDHTINSGTYSEVQTELQPDLVKEVANPTYGITDDTLKDLPNPFYGYGTHQEDHTINSGTYSEVQTELQPDLVKEVANPTYGITKDDVVLNPLYTTDTNRRETVGTSLSSSELYTEVPANKEVHAPDDK